MITGSAAGRLKPPQHLEAVDARAAARRAGRGSGGARARARRASSPLPHSSTRDASCCEVGAEELAQRAVVVDQQHGGVHGPLLQPRDGERRRRRLLRTAARLDRHGQLRRTGRRRSRMSTAPGGRTSAAGTGLCRRRQAPGLVGAARRRRSQRAHERGPAVRDDDAPCRRRRRRRSAGHDAGAGAEKIDASAASRSRALEAESCARRAISANTIGGRHAEDREAGRGVSRPARREPAARSGFATGGAAGLRRHGPLPRCGRAVGRRLAVGHGERERRRRLERAS